MTTLIFITTIIAKRVTIANSYNNYKDHNYNRNYNNFPNN